MKQRVKITTVDPSARRVEGVLKDGGIIQIAVYEIPTHFRWPREGELWTVTREGNYWYLGSAHEVDSSFPVEEMAPGDAKIGADRIYTQSGLRVLGIAEYPITGLSSAQIDALFPEPPTDGVAISDPTNRLFVIRQNGKWQKVALTLIP